MARPRAQVDLTALAPVFARSGASGASVDELARASGVAKPTLYERVGDKQELFRATCTAALERMLDRLYDAADRSRYAGPRERIAALALELADCDRAITRLVLVVETSPAALGRLRAAIAEPGAPRRGRARRRGLLDSSGAARSVHLGGRGCRAIRRRVACRAAGGGDRR